ncbi:MAG: MFS transporter [Deltaproteobacteria bacterium]|nr:MFS transporter [Deltaproteobacteria bacterium]MBT4089273.1 MFS transporter [Deltaproteobacteria bacterium]MBT4263473.1 MFS transporter [Deltaproteobacteria bacterium]MBT4644558.1 MFS transporter [Deltaproteobacteria bacterium]MBT6503541.1 MFS transporter [Deltaproteobacteria bacterium]
MKKYFYGYNIVTAGFFIQGICIGAMFTYGVFFTEFQQEFGWSRGLISGASSLSFFVMGAGAIFFGTLNDRFGPRIILTVSGFLLGIGYLLMSFIQVPWHLYILYGVLVGIGFSTHDVITLSTVARWFIRFRGRMTGLTKVGTGVGQFIAPIVATGLIAVYGWRNAYLMIGGFSLIVLVLLAQLMKLDPQSIGVLPDGESNTGADITANTDSDSLSSREALRTLQFWIICIAEFTVFFCLLTVIVHIIPHAQDQGLRPTLAAAVLSTIGSVSIIGRIVTGSLIDKIGGKRSLIFCFIILISSLIWLQLAAEIWMLFVFAFVYGFAHGGFFTVMSPLIAERFGIDSLGQLFGIVLFVGTLGGTIGPTVSGYIFDVTGSYQASFAVLTGIAILGLVLILFLRVKPETRSLLPPAAD